MASTIIGLNILKRPRRITEMGKATVDIDNRQTRFEISPKAIQEIARNILDALEFPDGELSLVLMDNAQITTINRDYLDRDRPTNVIAFPMRDGPFGDITPGLLGDVIISLQTADTEARNAGLSMGIRFCQLLVHGILHLFDYDHEKSKKDAAIMDAKSREILKLIVAQSESVPDFIDMRIDSKPTESDSSSDEPIKRIPDRPIVR